MGKAWAIAARKLAITQRSHQSLADDHDFYPLICDQARETIHKSKKRVDGRLAAPPTAM
jgi:hypothetical protein